LTVSVPSPEYMISPQGGAAKHLLDGEGQMGVARGMLTKRKERLLRIRPEPMWKAMPHFNISRQPPEHGRRHVPGLLNLRLWTRATQAGRLASGKTSEYSRRTTVCTTKSTTPQMVIPI